MALIVESGSVDYLHKVLSEISEKENWEELLCRLEERLAYLHHYGEKNEPNYRFDVYLGPDFSRWSFSIIWYARRTQKPWIYGGLIFHSRDQAWSVHT